MNKQNQAQSTIWVSNLTITEKPARNSTDHNELIVSDLANSPNWEQTTATLEKLLKYAANGHTVIPVDCSDRKSGTKAKSARFIYLDLDKGEFLKETLDELKELDIEIGGIYETLSSSPEALKHRLIFTLNQEIDHSTTHKLLKLLLADLTHVDKSCSNPIRIYYPSGVNDYIYSPEAKEVDPHELIELLAEKESKKQSSFKQSTTQKPKSKKPQFNKLSNIEISVNYLISTPNKARLEGVDENASSEMHKLAKELIGWKLWLENQGYKTDSWEKLQQTFNQACHSCKEGAAWQMGQIPDLWSQAIKGNPQPSCNYHDKKAAKNKVAKYFDCLTAKQETELKGYVWLIPEFSDKFEAIPEYELLSKKLQKVVDKAQSGSDEEFHKDLEWLAIWSYKVREICKEFNVNLKSEDSIYWDVVSKLTISQAVADLYWNKAQNYPNSRFTKFKKIIEQKIGYYRSATNPDYAELLSDQNSEIIREYWELQTEKKFTAWKSDRAFSPGYLLTGQYVKTLPKIENGSIFCLKAPTGAGKTTALCELLSRPENKEKQVYLLYSTNSLAIQTIAKLNDYFREKFSEENQKHVEKYGRDKIWFDFIHDLDLKESKGDPDMKIGLCTNSLHRFSNEDFEDSIIILDELTSLNKHTLTSSIVKNRTKNLSRFEQAIKLASKVICFDAHLSNIDIEYISKLAPKKQVIKSEFKSTNEKGKIYWYTGDIKADNQISENSKTAIVNRACKLVATGKKIIVTSDSKKFLEILKKQFQKSGLGEKQLVIHQETSSLTEVREFLENPEESNESYEWQITLASPTIVSGVSIDSKDYYDAHFGFYYGCLDANQIVQHLGRVRDTSVDKYVWVRAGNLTMNSIKSSNTGEYHSHVTEMLLSSVFKCYQGNEAINPIKIIKEFEQKAKHDKHYMECIRLEQKRLNELSNLRKYATHALKQEGYELIEFNDYINEKLKEDLKVCKEENIIERSEVLYEAKLIPLKEAEKDLKPDQLTQEVRKSRKLTRLVERRLPEIDHSSVFSPEFLADIEERRPELISNIENWTCLNNPHIPREQFRNQFEYQTKTTEEYDINSLHEIKKRMALIAELEDLGILELIKELEELGKFNKNSDAIKKLHKKVAKLPKTAQITKDKTKPTMELKRILKKIGISLTKSWKEGDTRFYAIDTSFKTDETWNAIREAIEKKFELIPRVNKKSKFRIDNENNHRIVKRTTSEIMQALEMAA